MAVKCQAIRHLFSHHRTISMWSLRNILISYHTIQLKNKKIVFFLFLFWPNKEIAFSISLPLKSSTSSWYIVDEITKKKKNNVIEYHQVGVDNKNKFICTTQHSHIRQTILSNLAVSMSIVLMQTTVDIQI